MKVSRIVRTLETIAPPQQAAEWDNVGLLVGDPSADVRKLLLCIDLTEQVLGEAVREKVGMVMAYHPVIFKSVSRITSDETPVLYTAARKEVAVYSTHTALDAAPGGTNDVLADAMGLTERKVLEPIVSTGFCKIVVFTPPDDLSEVADAAFSAGAGQIGDYSECAFFCHGIGSFFSRPAAHPSAGITGRGGAAEELRLEMIAPRSKASAICAAVRTAHSYEEPAIDVYPLEQPADNCGLGRIGRLKRPVTVRTMINRIKKATGLKRVLVTSPTASPTRIKSGDGRGALVSTASCCAGSCGKLFRKGVAGGATFYLTGEMGHHDALEARDSGMTVVCLGHSNSERITLVHLVERLKPLLPKVNVVLSKYDKDPFEIA